MVYKRYYLNSLYIFLIKYYESYPHNALSFVVESKNTTQYSKTNFYPNGIYINANGIKGHYITKEIEPKNQQSHSTKKSMNWNDTFNSIS